MATLDEVKEKAILYYKENGVPKKMQDVLNDMFTKQPKDVWGYLSSFFGQLSAAPSIVALTPRSCRDSKGAPALEVHVRCEAKNETLDVAWEQLAFDTSLLDNAKYEDKEVEDKRRADHVDAAHEIVGGDLSALLKGCNPASQESIDSCLESFLDRVQRKADEAAAAALESAAAASAAAATAAGDDKKGAKKSAGGGGKNSGKKKAPQAVVIPDAPREALAPGSLAGGLVSIAVCSAAAALQRDELFYRVAKVGSGGGGGSIECDEADGGQLGLPVPMISLLQGGKVSTGKSKCIKEYMLVPRPNMPVGEALQLATRVSEVILKALCAKGGAAAKSVTDFGSLAPAFDRPEQGLDMIQDAAAQLGLKMGEDLYLAINAAAADVFDYEKGKYEVAAGMLKATEDLPDFWADIINRYPAIVAIFDPARREETATWARLCELVSSKCYVLSDRGCPRPGLLLRNGRDGPAPSEERDPPCSGLTLRLEMRNTVTEMVTCCRQLTGAGRVAVLASGQHDTTSSAVVDVAVGSGASFVKLGGLSRGERLAKYNRLVYIADRLRRDRRLREPDQGHFVFQPVETRSAAADGGDAADEFAPRDDDSSQAAAPPRQVSEKKK